MTAELREIAADVFGAESGAPEPAVDVTMLHARIGELTLASDCLSGVRKGRTVDERKAMIDRSHTL